MHFAILQFLCQEKRMPKIGNVSDFRELEGKKEVSS